MFDLVKWVAIMAIVTFFILLIRAMLRKPAGTNQKRWVVLSTPELLDRAFQTEQMYEIAERTAQRHLSAYGTHSFVEFYTEIFKEFDNARTTDGYLLSGTITDQGEDALFNITLTKGMEAQTKEYKVSYVHLARVTDVLSPALLSRLNWHVKSHNSEG